MRETLLGIVFLIGSMLGITPQAQPVALGDSGTISQLSPWTTTASTTRLASTTAMFRIPFLASCDTIDTDSKGFFTCGTDTGGSATFPFVTESSWLASSTLINFRGGLMSMASSTYQNLNTDSVNFGDTASAWNTAIQFTNTGMAGNQTLTIDSGNYSPTLTFSGGAGNPTLGDWFDQSVKIAASPTHAGLTLSGLTLGELAVSSTGLVYKHASTTYSSGVAWSAGNVTNTGVTSLSASYPIVNSLSTGAIALTCPQCFTYTTTGAGSVSTTSMANFLGGVLSMASSTLQNLFATTLTVPPLTSALLLTNGSGVFAEYAGTSCTNQAVTGISALGASTCTSLTSAYFADADWGDITIASGVASVEDDSHAHTSTTLSGIDISADTNLSALYPAVLTGDVLSVATSSAFTVSLSATSTMGTGTTTIPFGSYRGGATFESMGCNGRGGGTFTAVLGDGTASSTYVVSATGLTTTYTTLSSNNVFTSGELIFLAYGSVSGTVGYPSCSFLRN